MPRNVRNFWIELSVDGRDSRVETGPVRKDGGFDMTIRIREGKSISDRLMRISGTADDEGKLMLQAVTNQNGQLLSIESKR